MSEYTDQYGRALGAGLLLVHQLAPGSGPLGAGLGGGLGAGGGALVGRWLGRD